MLDQQVNLTIAGREFRIDTPTITIKEIGQIAVEVKMVDRFIETQVTFTRRIFEKPTPVLTQILFIATYQVTNMEITFGNGIIEILKGLFDLTELPKEFIGEVVEKPLVDKRTGEAHIELALIDNLFINHTIQIKVVDARVIILKLNLVMGLEHF